MRKCERSFLPFCYIFPHIKTVSKYNIKFNLEIFVFKQNLHDLRFSYFD